MAVFAKGADPEALQVSATNFAGYARTCDEVRESIGSAATVIRANWSGGDLQALAAQVPTVQRQLTTIAQTLSGLGERLTANARAQQLASSATGSVPGAPIGGPVPGTVGTGHEGTDGPLGPLLDTLTPWKLGFWDARDLLAQGAAWSQVAADWDSKLGLWGNLEKYAADVDGAGHFFNEALEGKNWAEIGKTLSADGETLGTFGKAVSGVGKALGPIGVGFGLATTANDFISGHTGRGVYDGITTGLGAAALMTPPPADLVLGGASLAMTGAELLYDKVPFVHDAVDAGAHAVATVTDDAVHGVEHAWHSVTSWL